MHFIGKQFPMYFRGKIALHFYSGNNFHFIFIRKNSFQCIFHEKQISINFYRRNYFPSIRKNNFQCIFIGKSITRVFVQDKHFQNLFLQENHFPVHFIIGKTISRPFIRKIMSSEYLYEIFIGRKNIKFIQKTFALHCQSKNNFQSIL